MFLLLMHKKLSVRFLTLYLMGLLLFLLSWTFSYYVLPEGVLAGKSAAARLAGDQADALPVELLKIVGINLFSSLVVIMANLFIIRDKMPLGYFIPLLWFIHYGALLGTNSFSIPMEQPMAPSFEVLGRSGLYEMAAYTLMAAATSTIARYRLQNLFSRGEKFEPVQRLSLASKIGIGAAFILLISANLREAYQIIS
jgi:hypothetical protein